MPETSTDPIPNALPQRDAAALIGILAVLEGEHLAGYLDEDLSRRLGERLQRVGLLGDDWQPRELRQALNDMNHRIRYALGEYDDPPFPQPVP
jgi:hypothetical protein